jgi:predicted ribosomally synthesized peptide with nif11-like leader
MSAEQFKAFVEAVQADEGLEEKLKGARDADAVVAIAEGAGFNISKADWLEYQANQTLELSDEELESVTGGLRLGEGISLRIELWRRES